MAQHTLTLPKKPVKPDPLECIILEETPEQAEFNSTLLVPTTRTHNDYSHLPPPGERGAAPVQAPARSWGQPGLLGPPSARPAPQPLFVPPRGK